MRCHALIYFFSTLVADPPIIIGGWSEAGIDGYSLMRKMKGRTSSSGVIAQYLRRIE